MQYILKVKTEIEIEKLVAMDVSFENWTLKIEIEKLVAIDVSF